METVIQDLKLVFDFIMNHLVFINLILAVAIVFFQRREPKSVWAWLLILYFIPILGFLFYLLAGTDMHKRKMFRTKEIEDKLAEAIREQESSIRTEEMEKGNPDLLGFSDLIYYNLDSMGAVLSDDNAMTVYTDGNQKYDALIEDIKKAEKYIFIQYYIIRNDELFQRIEAVLLEKAKQGVEVRILFDGMGVRGFSHKHWKQLNAQGIHTAEFFPALFRRLQLRINYRNHRKIVVIDGTVGYVGGFNIGREYIDLDPKFGHWRDTHMRIEGSAVKSLQLRFVLDWNYAAKENLFRTTEYFEDIQKTEPKGSCEMQVIYSGPDTGLQNIRNNYLRLIAKAEKRIYIQTPYFIPDEAILNALIVAAHSGIEVNLMIPCKPDHPFIYWATYSYMGDLVAAGANCYVYMNGFLHTKGLMVDGKAMCYGTANMDIRSFCLNFEVNVIVYDDEETQKMEEIFKEDLKVCRQITRDIYNKRSLLIRIKEQFCRLLSPVL